MTREQPINERWWTGLRPRGPYRQGVVIVGLAAALTGIARTTGSGWAMVVVSGLVALLAIGAGWPVVVLVKARVAVEAPRDATVGRLTAVSVAVDGISSDVKLRISLPSPWVNVAAPAAGPVAVLPDHRGVVKTVEVVLRCGTPLGLFWWERRITAPLEHDLEVGPDPVAVALPQVLAGAIGEVRPPQRRSGNDSVRTVREYVAGDSTRLVHWGQTARRGELMVREMEDPEGSLLTVVVDLVAPSVAAAELAAAQAAGLANLALRSGIRVLLVTTEETGPRVSLLARPGVEVSRRLARAVAGGLPNHQIPSGATVVLVSGRTGITVRHVP